MKSMKTMFIAILLFIVSNAFSQGKGTLQLNNGLDLYVPVKSENELIIDWSILRVGVEYNFLKRFSVGMDMVYISGLSKKNEIITIVDYNQNTKKTYILMDTTEGKYISGIGGEIWLNYYPYISEKNILKLSLSSAFVKSSDVGIGSKNIDDSVIVIHSAITDLKYSYKFMIQYKYMLNQKISLNLGGGVFNDHYKGSITSLSGYMGSIGTSIYLN